MKKNLAKFKISNFRNFYYYLFLNLEIEYLKNIFILF